MKTFKLITIVALCMMMLNGCKKSDTTNTPPDNVVKVKATFSITQSSQTAPTLLTFKNTSQNAISYKWTFGDGDPYGSIDKNPVHQYSSAGTYIIKLVATGSSGIDSMQTSFTLSGTPPPAPIANFNFTGNGYPTCIVTFANTSQNSVTFQWDFGDGNTSTLKNPTHVYNAGGNYSVRLTSYNAASQSSSCTKTVFIQTAPTKAFITKVVVNSYPYTMSNGVGWDLTDGPDVYFSIYSNDVTEIFNGSSSHCNNLAPNQSTISWDFYAPYFEVPSFNHKLYIHLYDWDQYDSDDFMGSCGPFTTHDLLNGFPSSMTHVSGNISVTLYFSFQ